MKISIITICYNAEKEIERTIRSVLSQTFENLEYIIIDGGSKDSTLETIDNISKEYPNRTIKVVSESDEGIYDAMNKGIKFATGEWINMMNAGDTFANDNVLSNVFHDDIQPNISFIYSDLYKATKSGKYFLVNMTCSNKGRKLVHQSVIYRKSLHDRFGYYVVSTPIIVSDFLFFLQIPLAEIHKTNTVIAKYEGGGVSETGSWCIQGALCANVVFRKSSFWSIYLKYLVWKLKHLVPLKIREYLRLKNSGVRI